MESAFETLPAMIKEYSGHTTDGVQGIGKYKMVITLMETNQCADGEPGRFNLLRNMFYLVLQR